jgi:hypothetical protein
MRGKCSSVFPKRRYAAPNKSSVILCKAESSTNEKGATTGVEGTGCMIVGNLIP